MSDAVLRRAAALLLSPLLLAAAPLHAAPPAELCLSDARGLKVADARLFPGARHAAPRVSDHAEAQRYFEQALVMGWGFNFAESVRSFRTAVQLDPGCAACRWGVAWALGPSINHDMDAADLPVVRDALLQARVHAAPDDARTRELVAALALRYPSATELPRGDDAQRYAAAMAELAQRRPDDADLQVLAAEALMNAHPYDWWDAKGRAWPWTPRIAALLDRAVALAPDHAGAHHYRVHLYDDSPDPARALDSARRLPAVAPDVGHLVHMAAHTALRTGHYHEAVLANDAAVAADLRYAAATKMDPAYAAGYALHSRHHLWAAALWSGESQRAGDAARDIVQTLVSEQGAQRVPANGAPPTDDAANDSAANDDATHQYLLATPWLTDLRFGRWEAVLQRPVPADDAGPLLAGLVSFARGVAHARRSELPAAQRDAAQLDSARKAASKAKLQVRQTHAADGLLAVAAELLRSEIAGARGERAAAVRHAQRAVALEDRLAGDEPPVWQIPARHRLGEALLQQQRAQAALAAFDADLQRHPANAVGLAGRAEALRRLQRAAPADQALVDARLAWRHADVPLPQPW